MDLTSSYATFIPADVLPRYEWRETRNAAGILASTNPTEYQDLIDVLRAFALMPSDIIKPGGNKSAVAKRLDEAFRKLGWREGRYDTRVQSTLRIMPYRSVGEKKPIVVATEATSEATRSTTSRGAWLWTSNGMPRTAT